MRESPDPIPAESSSDDLDAIRKARARWEATAYAKGPRRSPEFRSASGIPLKPLYTPADVPETRYLQDLGFPGEYPYTRGIHATMYRGSLWTFRQLAGCGSAEHTNARFHALLRQGAKGLNVCLDMATIMGYDSDSPHAAGEVGNVGVAIDSLEDMQRLFQGVRVDEVSASFVSNCQAIAILPLYAVMAERRGIPAAQLAGTLQNDVLKEYIAQKSWAFPPAASLRIVTDIMTYCARHLPRWNTVSVSGYHIRAAGGTAVQELAFTLADGVAYLEAGTRAGLAVDDFAPRPSFFFKAHNDFFEEVAKFRAARRLWARIVRERFGATQPRAWMLRFHCQTSGSSLTAQQPENNIVRTTVQAMAGILGGCQSLHTNAYDEALALPSEKAARVALRTQQILAHESGLPKVIDPLGGSYYVEALTDELEARAGQCLEKIETLGGVVRAIETGYLQKEIADAAFAYQQAIERGEITIVGLNDFFDGNAEAAIPLFRVDPANEARQVERLKAYKARQDRAKVGAALEALKAAARGTENLMARAIEAVRAGATLGEIMDSLREVFGVYHETEPAL